MNGHAGWQPIATAPKDGTKVLLRKDGEIFVGWYDDKHDEKYAWWFVDSTEMEEKIEQPFGYSETFVRMNAWGKGHGPEEWRRLEELAELVAKQAAALKLAREAIGEVQDLIGESHGVYGLHLNGDESPWGELEQGGRFERLTLLNEALAAIDALKGE